MAAGKKLGKKGERLKRNISAKPAAGERNLQPNEYVSLDHNEQQKELLELRWGSEALLNSITEAGVLWLFPRVSGGGPQSA